VNLRRWEGRAKALAPPTGAAGPRCTRTPAFGKRCSTTPKALSTRALPDRLGRRDECYYERGKGLRIEHAGAPFAMLPHSLIHSETTRCGISARNILHGAPDAMISDADGDAPARAATAETSPSPSLPTTPDNAAAPSRARPWAGRRSSRSIPWSGSSVLRRRLFGFRCRRGSGSR
jgi:hypothetical protein